MSGEKCFISRNYKARFSAAGKAKIDCEETLQNIGFRNLGLPRTTYTSTLPNFFLTLLGTCLGLLRLKRGSILVVQYPTKKYYDFIVRIARRKQCRVITLIHDLRSHRKQRMDIAREISSLNRNDLIISHNARMTAWLRTNGLTTQVVDLDIFDYHCDSRGNNTTPRAEGDPYRLVFAGVLEKRKNGFLYQLDDLGAESYLCNLYGIGFDPADLPSKSLIHYRGVFPADEIVDRIEGDFGIVWDGISVEECAGSFGEYLKINNPHKTSMYLRAGLPVIIWDQAAMATLVTKRNVGIAVSSLAQLEKVLENLSEEAFQQMRHNAQAMSQELGAGAFLSAAIDSALGKLSQE